MRDMLDELEAMQATMQSIEHGDYIKRIHEEDSAAGQQIGELQKLRQDFDKYCSDYAAYKAAEEHSRKAERHKTFAISAIVSFITAALANLMVYYWPKIIKFFVH